MKLISGTVLQSATRFTVKVLVVAAATVGGGALVSSSVFASLSAVATGTTAVDAGTLIFNAPLYPGTGGVSTSLGLGGAITQMKPGDIIHRYVTLTNSGTMSSAALKFSIQDTVDSILTTDATNGLKVTVTRCSTFWAWVGNAAATCGPPLSPGTSTSWLASTALSTLALAEGSGLNFIGSPALVYNETAYLKLDIQLPDRVERRANGGTPTAADGTTPLTNGTLQGATAAITWTFFGEQASSSETNS